MKANMVKWINYIYQMISHSGHFWIRIFTKGIVQTLIGFFEEDHPEKVVKKTRYQQALSVVWLLLFINLFLASTLYMKLNHPLINFFSYIILLVFIVCTVFTSWLSYVQVISDVSTEEEALLTAFYSSVRYWTTSLSFSLFIIVAIIIGYSNLIILVCLLPGLYVKLSQLMMSRYQELIQDAQLQLKN